MIHDSLNSAWLATLRTINTCGDNVLVRGNATREILGDTVAFPMRHSILSYPTRRLSRQFMFREAWWILSGNNNLDVLQAFAPSMKNYSDDGIRLSGAYGPKIVDQITYVVDALGQDPHTRQAVINIWRERPGVTKDVPCTLSAQFTIRNGYIHTFVNMRSSDIWLGMPYDVFTFTMLTCLVAIECCKRFSWNLRLGNMYHTAASRHMYLRDSEKIKECLRAEFVVNADHGPDIDLEKLTVFTSCSRTFVQLLHDASINALDNNPVTNLLPWLV